METVETAKRCPECRDFPAFSFAELGFAVGCETCGRRTSLEDSLHGAIQAWNADRVDSSSTPSCSTSKCKLGNPYSVFKY